MYMHAYMFITAHIPMCCLHTCIPTYRIFKGFAQRPSTSEVEALAFTGPWIPIQTVPCYLRFGHDLRRASTVISHTPTQPKIDAVYTGLTDGENRPSFEIYPATELPTPITQYFSDALSSWWKKKGIARVLSVCL